MRASTKNSAPTAARTWSSSSGVRLATGSATTSPTFARQPFRPALATSVAEGMAFSFGRPRVAPGLPATTTGQPSGAHVHRADAGGLERDHDALVAGPVVLRHVGAVLGVQLVGERAVGVGLHARVAPDLEVAHGVRQVEDQQRALRALR